MDLLTSFLVGLAFASVLSTQSVRSPAGPFVGTWTANLARSRQHPDDQFKNQTLTISIVGQTVTILDIVVRASGQEERRTNVFEIDAQERPHPAVQGFVLVAQLRDRIIETIAKKDGQVFGRTELEHSPDGLTLTSRAYDATGTELQAIVFERR